MRAVLTAVRRPLLAGNMTCQELVKEAEHLFPNPTPIIKRMIEELRGDRAVIAGSDHALPVGVDIKGDGVCPCCGAQVTIELQG